MFYEKYLELRDGYVPLAQVARIKKRFGAWWALVRTPQVSYPHHQLAQIGANYSDADRPDGLVLAKCTVIALPADTGSWAYLSAINPATGEIRHERVPVEAWLWDAGGEGSPVAARIDGPDRVVVALRHSFPSTWAYPRTVGEDKEDQIQVEMLPYETRSGADRGHWYWSAKDIDDRLREQLAASKEQRDKPGAAQGEGGFR